MAADPAQSARRGRGRGLEVAWVAAMAVTILAGLALAPLGAVIAVVCAVVAHREGYAAWRAAFAALAIVFVLLTVFVGTMLLSTGGGGSSSTPREVPAGVLLAG
jgi:hypothetical protein